MQSTIRTTGTTSGRVIRPTRPGASLSAGIRHEVQSDLDVVKHPTHRWTLAPILLGTATLACAPQVASRAPSPGGPEKTGVDVLYVRSAGDAAAPRTERPTFTTLAEAIDTGSASQVRLLPGTHRGPPVYIDRKLTIEGAPGAQLATPLFVGADEVVLRDLKLLGGLSVGFARGVRLENLVVEPGLRNDALSIHRSDATLENLSLSGGPQTALQVTASTVALGGSRVRGRPGLRSVRLDGGILHIRGSHISGGWIATVQLTGSSTLTLASTRIGPSPGNGLLLTPGTAAVVDDSYVADVVGDGLVVRGSTLLVRGSTVGTSGRAALRISGNGASVVAKVSSMEAGSEGAIVLDDSASPRASVLLQQVVVSHPARVGVALLAGRLSARRVEFQGGHIEGDLAAPLEEMAALSAVGPGAVVDVETSTFSESPGFAVLAANDAEVRLHNITINEPAGGGVFLSGLMTGAALSEMRIEGCRTGSGLRVLGSTSVSMTAVSVAGCAEGGLVAGGRGRLQLRQSRVSGADIGVAAFGGTELLVEGSTLAGHRWAAFAGCGLGARILDFGNNQFDGPICRCP